MKLLDGLKIETYGKGEFVIKEGTPGNEFYIIESGEVDCLKLHTINDKRGFVLVRTLASGDHFGELAIIKNETRSLSVRAKSDCKVLTMDRLTFQRILGSIEDKLRKDYDKEFDKKLKENKDLVQV